MCKFNRFVLSILLLSTFGLIGFSLAETLDASLPWGVVAGGAGLYSDGDVSIQSTLGQVVIGETSGGNVVIRAGFWQRNSSCYKTYLPGVYNNY